MSFIELEDNQSWIFNENELTKYQNEIIKALPVMMEFSGIKKNSLEKKIENYSVWKASILSLKLTATVWKASIFERWCHITPTSFAYLL